MKSIALWSLISGLTPFDVGHTDRVPSVQSASESTRKPSRNKWRALATAAMVLTGAATLASVYAIAGGLRGGVVNDNHHNHHRGG